LDLEASLCSEMDLCLMILWETEPFFAL